VVRRYNRMDCLNSIERIEAHVARTEELSSNGTTAAGPRYARREAAALRRPLCATLGDVSPRRRFAWFVED
jgi:hypothetical protein